MLRLFGKRLGRGFASVTSVEASQVAGMRAREVGDLLNSFSKEQASLDKAKSAELSNHIDEFFR